MMTSLLVTGAGGFIGRRVVDAANNAGYGVAALVRKPSPDCVPRLIQRDLRLPLEDLPAVDWVIHLAGAYAGAGDEELRRADLKIARNVIQSGLKAGVKNWIFASAAEVYGEVEGIADEEAPTHPVIPYGRIKLEAEQLFIEQIQGVSNSRVVILRIGEVYGSGCRLINELTVRLKRGFCPWPGSGRVPLSFVHVDDVAQAFLCAIQNSPAGVSVFNVADDTPVTWRAFLCRVAQHCKTRPPIFLPEPLVHFYAACSTMAHRAIRREPILTPQAIRLIITPKMLSNARLKCDLRFRPRYTDYSSGLKEVLLGLPHHA